MNDDPQIVSRIQPDADGDKSVPNSDLEAGTPPSSARQNSSFIRCAGFLLIGLGAIVIINGFMVAQSGERTLLGLYFQQQGFSSSTPDSFFFFVIGAILCGLGWLVYRFGTAR
jgi:uncharacterized membrane protein